MSNLFEPSDEKTNIMSFASSEDSDQPGHLPSLNRVLVFVGLTDHFVGFVMRLHML